MYYCLKDEVMNLIERSIAIQHTHANDWLCTTIQHGYIPVQDSNDEIFEQ